MDGGELCDRKRCREENPQDEEEAPPSPPPPGDKKKKKKKKRRKHKNKSEGSEVYPNPHEPVAVCPTPISITASQNNNDDESVEPNKMKPLLNEAAEDAHESDPIEQQLSRSQLRNIRKARKRNQQLQSNLDQPQHKITNKKKKTKSELKSQGEEQPNQHNGKPHETPSVFPVAATPIELEQEMTMNKRNSALNTEGEELHKDNADATVETPVQRTEGLTVKKVAFKWPSETSARKYNAKSPVKTRCPPRTDGVKVTEPPVKRHAESSIICRACRQHGHKSEDCPRLKCLSKDEEICFFCGEIGHSLGKCSVSTAGGGRFAKCLFCYAQGHFSNNCPRNGYRIDPKVAAAKWAYQQNSAK